MRLFIAANLPEDIQGALQDNLQDLHDAGLQARFSQPENLHVTLAFLGDTDEALLPRVKSALSAAAQETYAFDAALSDYGTFGKSESATLWQGFEDSTGFEQLAETLRAHLEEAGVPFDRKSFAAHVTLARKVPVPPEGFPEPWVDEGLIAAATLYRSRLSSDGPTYEPLLSVSLQKPYEHPDDRLLLIDADACPVTREALTEARRAKVPVLLVGNGTQNLQKHVRKDDPQKPQPGFWVATMNVQAGADVADFQLATLVRAGDVVVTQDIGVAAMALGAGAEAIGVRGKRYAREAIDALLLVRHEEKKVRRQGGKTQGPAAFTAEDRERFMRNLRRMLE